MDPQEPTQTAAQIIQ